MRKDFKFIFLYGVVAVLCLTSRSDASTSTTAAATTTAAPETETTTAAAVTTSAAATTGTNAAADVNTATTVAKDAAEMTLPGQEAETTTAAATTAGAGVTTAASNSSHSNGNGSVTVATPIECYECKDGVGCNLNNTCIGTACWINYDLTNMKELKRGCVSGVDNSTVCSITQSWANSACQSCCKSSLCNIDAAVTTIKDFCVKQSAAARLAAGDPWWRHAVVMVTVAVATRFGCVALL